MNDSLDSIIVAPPLKEPAVVLVVTLQFLIFIWLFFQIAWSMIAYSP